MRPARIVVPLLVLTFVGCQDGRVTVGPTGNRTTVLPTGQSIPEFAHSLNLEGRPVDGRAIQGGKYFVVKDFNGVRVINSAAWNEVGKADLPGGASLWGMAVGPGSTIWVTSASNKVHQFSVSESGVPKLQRSIEIPGIEKRSNSFPCGIVVADSGRKAYVCASLNNALVEVDLVAGKVTRSTVVGVAPYDVEIANGRLFVSCMGGPKPQEGERSAPSAGTSTRVDLRGVALTGSVAVVDVANFRLQREIPVGLQPSDMVPLSGGSQLAVCNTNSDSVAFINTETLRITKTLDLKPSDRLPFGSMPNALAATGNRLYVANAGNNAVASVDVSGTPKLIGFHPTHWYPAALAVLDGQMIVVNNKGFGSRSPKKADGAARNSHDKGGTVIKFPLPTDAEFRAATQEVLKSALIPASLKNEERLRRSSAKPVPVPAKLGDPSLIKHVVYVIKENRTYDQMLGDMKEGAGDPKLCQFPESVSPNHHALARQFVLLDNYYCNGVLSADGHSWATEGNVTPYLQRAFGGFNRSYTFGDDPITYSSSGFLWDQVLQAGYSFRNYGEFDDAKPEAKMTGQEIFEAYRAGKPLKFRLNIGIENLRRYSNPNSPGWNMDIPDQLRMDRFLEEFREFEKQGNLPNLIIIHLPQDHTGGPVTPRSHVADNDLAIGRLVEAFSKSRFWKETAIFINEDDPQAGTDHVDGHRSLCLVVSPYTRHRGTISEFYNQVSVLRTIHRIFGIAPVNQQYLGAKVMFNCFGNAPDLSPYTAITPGVSIYEYNRPLSSLPPLGQELALKLSKIDLSEREVQTPEQMDTLNRWVWHHQMGWGTPYPAEWAGAHGRGLTERGLKFSDLFGELEEEGGEAD